MTITWDETAPADSDAASAGDDSIRATKAAIAAGVAASMYWPGSGSASATSAGYMKPGAARMFYGAESAVSKAQDGQLMYASDTSRLWYVGTTGPVYLGGQYGIESASNPGAGGRWHMASGSSSNGGLISYGVTYGVAPKVVVSVSTSAAVGLMSVVTGVVTTGFHVGAYDATGAILPAGAATVYWESLGTVAI